MANHGCRGRPACISAPIMLESVVLDHRQRKEDTMLSDTDLIILRAAVNICAEARNKLTDAGIDSDDRSRQREAFYCAGAFDVARDALQSGLINYEVRFTRPEPVAEPQSLRVPDDAPRFECDSDGINAWHYACGPDDAA